MVKRSRDPLLPPASAVQRYPYQRLQEEGYEVKIAAPTKKIALRRPRL